MIIISTLSTPSGIVVVVTPVLGSTFIQSGNGEPSFIMASYLTMSEPVSLNILKLRVKPSLVSISTLSEDKFLSFA